MADTVCERDDLFVSPPPGDGTTNNFDGLAAEDVQGVPVYNWKLTNTRRLSAGLARASQSLGTANLAFLGESTVAGQGATRGTESFPDVIRKTLASSGYPIAGVFSQARSAMGSSFDPRWTFGAGWSPQAADSLIVSNGSTTNALTFVSTAAGTSVTVVFAGAGGSFTVEIDGGSAITVNPSGNTMKTHTITGLANTAHTVVIKRVSLTIYIMGVEIGQNSTGLRVWNCGVSGAKASNLDGGSYFEAGKSVNGPAFDADCVFIGGLCINDAAAGTTTSGWKTAIGNIITQINFYGGTDIVLVHSSDTSSGNLASYRTAMYELADSNDLPLIDITEILGTYAEAVDLGLMFDVVHPNAAGYSLVGKSISRIID